MANIERYIIFEIAKPLLAVTAILTGLFACFSSARYLAEGITQTLGLAMMLKLVLLKTLIALEVLFPIAFYVAIVIGLGRLHRDQEIIAMRAAGVNGFRIVKSVLLMSVPVAIVVGILSMSGRPWAYEISYLLDARAEAELNTDRFQAGRFYGSEDSGRVVYIKKKDKGDGEMHEVFHYLGREGANELVMARFAQQQQVEQRSRIDLQDGMLYRIKRDGSTADEVTRFTTFAYYLEDPKESIGYKRKAAGTGVLMQSEASMDIAELQWRLSRPLAAILLALIAVPLSRSSPRQGKNEKIFTAALVFAVYYNLSGLARTWVEQGVVGSFPGMWWLQALMLVVVVVFLWPDLRQRWVRRA